MSNQLIKSFLLTLLVVGILFGMFFLPRLNVGGKDWRRVNLLRDVQHRDSAGNILAEVRMDSLAGTWEIGVSASDSAENMGIAFDEIVEGEPSEEPSSSSALASTSHEASAKAESSASRSSEQHQGGKPSEQSAESSDVSVERDSSVHVDLQPIDYSDIETGGLVPIEDFGGSMSHFRSVLQQSGSRNVRIAFFGDSFIEGDILTSDLREMLQSRYGGKGVGWLDISCVSEKFRLTARTSSSGWESHHANDKRGHQASLQGLNGAYFLCRGNATFTATGTKGRAASADKATVLYAPGGLTLKGGVNGGAQQALSEENYGSLSAATIHADGISKFSLNASGNGRVLGVALDGKTGISLDNYSMRGSNGWYTANTTDDILSSYARVRPYDLFVFEYGLNIANKNQTKYTFYTDKFKKVIRKIKAHFPNASILIVGSGDRDERSDNGFVTMRGVKELISAQRQMAADEGVAFWNLYAAMGGEGSIARMQQKKQANLDYTHINAAGGKVLAKSLFDALTH